MQEPRKSYPYSEPQFLHLQKQERNTHYTSLLMFLWQSAIHAIAQNNTIIFSCSSGGQKSSNGPAGLHFFWILPRENPFPCLGWLQDASCTQ